MISDFLSIFVLLILLISFDFWTVKNVTGRLLVGLRWWNRIDDEGRSHWIFENRHNTTDANKDDSFKASDRLSDNSADSTIFWTALIIAPILWFILLLVTVFRLNVQWFVCIIEFILLLIHQLIHQLIQQMIVCLALVLSSSNLYGYIRCKLGGNLKSVLTQYVGKQIFYNVINILLIYIQIQIQIN